MSDKLRILPLALLCLYISKVLFRGADISDALIILGLIGLSSFIEYKEKDNKYQELNKEVADLRATIKFHTASYDELRTKIAAMQVSSGMKSLQRG